jgi:hypothetical protein
MAKLTAQYIETETLPNELDRDWYIVDGEKYAVTGEIGGRGRLLDSEGTPLARLARWGYATDPLQLRYNAIYCDPAARLRAMERFEAIATAIRECDDQAYAVDPGCSAY